MIRVSGFTYCRNALELGYPLLESIQSVLPLCDEFIVADGESTDGTREAIESLASKKIRIITYRWDPELRIGGQIMTRAANAADEELSRDPGFHQAKYDFEKINPAYLIRFSGEHPPIMKTKIEELDWDFNPGNLPNRRRANASFRRRILDALSARTGIRIWAKTLIRQISAKKACKQEVFDFFFLTT